MDILSYDERELDLIMQDGAAGAEDGARSWGQDGRGGFEEEEGAGGERVVEFFGVVAWAGISCAWGQWVCGFWGGVGVEGEVTRSCGLCRRLCGN